MNSGEFLKTINPGIDDILAIAIAALTTADKADDLRQATAYATIAQAAAQTAQAMMAYEQRKEWHAAQEIPGWYEGQPSTAGTPF